MKNNQLFLKNNQLFLRRVTLGLGLGAALSGMLTGCVRYVDRGEPSEVYGAPVVVEDDYVYYPNYEIYYSRSRHQYAYRDGRHWVSRPAPRGVSVDVLFASPSVRMNFHDSPARHHEAIIRQYPRNWSPPDRPERRDERRDDRQDQRNPPDRGGDNRGR